MLRRRDRLWRHPWTWGSATLAGDLVCDVSPALRIVGPFTLDLEGATISCEVDDAVLTMIGIAVAGVGARVRNGTIADCDRGVVVEGDGRHEVKRLTLTSPNATGDQGIAIQVKSDRNRFIENTIQNYAGEGFRLGDDEVPANRNVLIRNEAITSDNHGFRVRIGQHNLLLLNRAEGNAAEGFRSQDAGNRFIANTAVGNGDEGFRVRDGTAQDNAIIGNLATENGLQPCSLAPLNPDANPGIAITNDAASNKVIGNVAEGNCVGIAVAPGSVDNQITNNVALDNSLVDLADGNTDL